MGLEQLLATINNDAQSRITSRSKRRLHESVQQLQHYSLSTEEVHELNKSAAALMRRHNNGLQGYENIATTIYAHADQHSSNCMHTPIYDAFRASRRNYINRFADIHEHLDNAQISYHDALQIRDDLLSNTYLRRKSRTNTSFAQHRQQLINRIDRELAEHNKPVKNPSFFNSIAVPAAATYGALSAAYELASAILW